MTPTEIITTARDLYNATGDTYFTDTQMYNWIWQAEHELAKKAWLIERVFAASTIANTQDYTYPTNTIAIKRATVNGRKIKRITHREDDAVTLSNATAQTSGWPSYYTDFNYTVSLRPIPDAVYTLKLYTYCDAAQVTASTVLEVPTIFHMDIVDFLLWRMFGKDKAMEEAQIYGAVWAEHVRDAVKYKNRIKRTDSFATVQSEDTLPANIIGEQ